MIEQMFAEHQVVGLIPILRSIFLKEVIMKSKQEILDEIKSIEEQLDFEYDSDETDTLHQDNLICMIEELEKQLKEQFSN